jgi:hydroxyacylglutathione hydrolase
MAEAFTYTHKNLTVWQLRALKDNYIYVLVDKKSKDVVVVDPSEAEPVVEFLQTRNLKLTAIWNTHHHHDHIGGNAQLQDEFKCPAYCSAYDQPRIPGATHGLTEKDAAFVGATAFQIINLPGHTLGAIAFYNATEKMVFTGDTLFTMGCGRIFEGSFEQMWRSMQRLKDLPDDTAIYCGHEYTLQNVAFALAQEPRNSKIFAQLRDKAAHTKAMLGEGRPTVPGVMGDEKALNPFLRAQNQAAFSELRRLKDEFRLEP